MIFNEFGKDGASISRVGLGCWQLGSDWGEVDLEAARSILKASVDAGVNFFDTADVYGAGRSEEIIGSFLADAGLRGEVFVATKLGRFAGLYPDNYTRETVAERVEDSLRRLRVEALDLVQLHCIPTAVTARDEIWQWLEELVAAGKIKRYGASVETIEEGIMCMEKAPRLTSLQVLFNVFRQRPATELFAKAQAARVGIIARVPLASGLLSGKFKPDTTFVASDHRNYNREGKAFNVGETFTGLPFQEGVALAQQLQPLVPEGMTMAQMALRWILDHEAVSVVIPGATRVEQARGNAAAADLPPLSRDLHNKLRSFYEDRVDHAIRGPY